MLSLFSANEEIDDINTLPPLLIPIFKNPYRAFGLDKDQANIKVVRDAFRKSCLSFVPYFANLEKPKLTLMQLLFAYHLIRGTVKGPSTKILEALESSPYFDFESTDILPLLRPIKGKTIIPTTYRGFRMLAVVCTDFKMNFSYTELPTIMFVFDVHYVMRRHTVELDLKDFQELHEDLKGELLTLPAFPALDIWQLTGIKSPQSIGAELAEYVMRIHSMLSNLGKFSPRLFTFLKIDFQQVQSEEEGAILAILDVPFKPRDSAWHIIDENWLKKWRKFAMGRGPRRYLPPGPISNQHLALSSKLVADHVGMRDMKLSVHYRSVVYNAWKFYEVVHGGGPIISRKEEELYSGYAVSRLQAVIMIQVRMRIFLAKKRREILLAQSLSMRNAAQAVIRQESLKNIQRNVAKLIRSQTLERDKKKLEKYIRMTQQLWREKRNSVPEESLERMKKDQEVFSRIKGGGDTATQTEILVVKDVHPILHIGTTNKYIQVIQEQDGIKIPFGLRKIPGTETPVICKSDNDSFVLGSKLIAINNYPTSSLSFEDVKKRLETAPFPLVLELERPYFDDQLPSLDAILFMSTLTGQNDPTVLYQSLKMLLSNGIDLIKHNSGNSGSHLTRFRISDKELLYRRKHSAHKQEDLQWKTVSLYKIKFLLGPVTRIIKKKEEETITPPPSPPPAPPAAAAADPSPLNQEEKEEEPNHPLLHPDPDPPLPPPPPATATATASSVPQIDIEDPWIPFLHHQSDEVMKLKDKLNVAATFVICLEDRDLILELPTDDTLLKLRGQVEAANKKVNREEDTLTKQMKLSRENATKKAKKYQRYFMGLQIPENNNNNNNNHNGGEKEPTLQEEKNVSWGLFEERVNHLRRSVNLPDVPFPNFLLNSSVYSSIYFPLFPPLPSSSSSSSSSPLTNPLTTRKLVLPTPTSSTTSLFPSSLFSSSPFPPPPSGVSRSLQQTIQTMTADDHYHLQRSTLFISLLRETIKELRGSQIYLNKEGLPLKRSSAKSSLRKIES